MQQVVPTLRITDYEESAEFYVRRLGFSVDWEHKFDGNFPTFMQISKSGLTIYLTEHSSQCAAGGLVYFYVSDVDSWYAHCTSRGISADHPPTNEPWGNRDFSITDPDGNQICVATRLPLTRINQN